MSESLREWQDINDIKEEGDRCRFRAKFSYGYYFVRRK